MSSGRAGAVEASGTAQASAPNAHESQPLIAAEEGSAKTQAAVSKPSSQVQQLLKENTAEVEKAVENDKAELQRALEHMPQDVVSEASLHEVPWDKLGWEFGVNVGVSLLGMVLVYMTMWKLPNFLFKLYIVPMVAVLIFALLVVIYEQIRYRVRDPSTDALVGSTIFLGSPFLQVILGRKVLKLTSPSDVYIFAHTLERKPNELGAFVERVVNPMNPTLPRKIWHVGEEDIAPERWKVVRFHCEGKDFTEELKKVCGGDLYPPLSQVVENWALKDPALKMPCVVELRPATVLLYFTGLKDHWLVRAILSMLIFVIFVMPAVRYLNQMRLHKNHYCKKGKTNFLPFCKAGEDGHSCQAHCDGLFSFLSEVGSRINVEEIEFVWTICLSLVFIFVFAILYVRGAHRLKEIKFILGMGGITREDDAEFTKVQRLLDDSLSIFGITKGIARQFSAYRSSLKASDPLDQEAFSGTSNVRNPCFWECTREWRNSQIGQAASHIISMPLSVSEHHVDDIHGKTMDLHSWADKIDSAQKELAKYKNLHDLSTKGSGRQPGMKFSVAVPVTCKESLEILKTAFFEKTGPSGYKSQLDAIFAADDCQDNPPSANGDSAGFCHVQEDFRAGPLLIPAGVCLTHVACLTPEQRVLSLTVGKGKDISSREAFQLLFYGKETPELNNALTLELFGDRYHWPPVMLPSASRSSKLKQSEVPVDSQGLAATVRGSYVYQFSFVFQITPSYFEALKRTQKDSDITIFGFTENVLTRLHDSPVLEPVLGGDLPRKLEDLKAQSWLDASGSGFGLVLEVDKAATRARFLSLVLLYLEYFGMFLLCLAFVLIVPLWRHFRWGGEFFPAPFTTALVANAVVQLTCLLWFVWLFNTVSGRLLWIGTALNTLAQKTLSPPSVGTKGKYKKHRAAAHASTTFRDSNTEDSPFRLYLHNIEDYDAKDPQYIAKWQAKERAVWNWHLCARYLRVLVSRTRLTAQAVLVCTAAILAILLLVDLYQGLHGVGIVQTHQNVAMQDAADAIRAQAQALAQTGADKAAQAASNLGKGAAAAAGNKLTGSRRLLGGEPFDFANASQALVGVLAPVDDAVQRVRQRQLLDFDMERTLIDVGRYVAVGDIRSVTQANLLTIAMTLLMVCLTWYLLVKIAQINSCVDQQESILLQVKEQHTFNHSERERLRGEKASLSSDQGEESASTARVDQAQASYERMLDICIQSAHDSKSHFPMKMFGFIVTRALLMAWLATAVQPLVGELGKVIPPLAVDACKKLESSSVGKATENSLKGTTSAAGKAVLNTNKEVSTGDGSIIYSLVCEPMLSALNTPLDGWKKDIDAAKSTSVRRLLEETRRADEQLLSKNSVRRLVEDWWDAHPGDADSKAALVRTVFQERQRSVRQLLTAGPEALRDAITSGNLRLGALASSGLQRRSHRAPQHERPVSEGEL